MSHTRMNPQPLGRPKSRLPGRRAKSGDIVPVKYRRKTLYAQLRKRLGEGFRRLAEQKESRIEQERDPFGSGIRREPAEFCWAAFLGARLRGVDSWI